MSEKKLTLSGVSRDMGKYVWIATRALLGFLLPLMLLPFLANGMRNASAWLDTNASPTFSLLFVLVCMSGWLGLMLWVKPDHLRTDAGEIKPAFASGFVTLAASLWVYIFALLSWTLMHVGAVKYVFASAPGNELSDLLDSYLWHLLDLIPALHVNEALGWQADVELSGGARGFILLLFRVLIVFQVFAFARKLFAERAAAKKAA